jgi:DedD protein
MAAKEKKAGDFVLESRHLVGLFLLLVVIFGVVFTLGYMLGRSQYDSKLRAAVGAPPGIDAAPAPAATPKTKAKTDADTTQAPKKNSDWDFYHSADPQPSADRLQPPLKNLTASSSSSSASAPATANASVKTSKPPKGAAGNEGPLIPKGAVMLQVAAVLHQDDALALAQALQQKKFPAFVIPPSSDKYYRVQVGPYPDSPSATKARQDLETDGFKSIVKR